MTANVAADRLPRAAGRGHGAAVVQELGCHLYPLVPQSQTPGRIQKVDPP